MRLATVGAVLGIVASVGAGGCGPAGDRPWFVDVAAAQGLDFERDAGASGQFFLPEIMGAGCALVDYDNDGDLDIAALQGFDLTRIVQPSGSWTPPAGVRNRLYRNELGDASRGPRFVDVTATAGLTAVGYPMGIATGDYDADGDIDLFVTSFGPNQLLRNESDGTFTDVSATALPPDDRWSTSAVFLDYDRDGRLDIFYTNYVAFSLRDNPRCYGSGGVRDYCSPKVFAAVPDRLLHNEGDGRFTDATEAAGLLVAYGSGLGVSVVDANRDGLPDLVVANDGNANQLWMNRGDGTFVDRALLAGVALNAEGQAEAGMGITAGDFDMDDDPDLLLTHLLGETNTLLVNRGDGLFSDRTDEHRLGSVSRRLTGFGVHWADLDGDGVLDLFIANGAVKVGTRAAGDPFPYRQLDQLLLGTGPPDFGFRDATIESGLAELPARVSRGAAFGDVDNDGDIDILVCSVSGALRLLRNDVAERRAWIGISLTAGDTVGTVIRIHRKTGAALRRVVGSGGSYASASDPRLTIGLGDERQAVAVEVVWPDGYEQRFESLGLRRYHELSRSDGR